MVAKVESDAAVAVRDLWVGYDSAPALESLAFDLPAGALVGLHWLLFYGCIKYAGVAVAVLCLSTITFFTACCGVSTSDTTPGRDSLEQSYLRLQ